MLCKLCKELLECGYILVVVKRLPFAMQVGWREETARQTAKDFSLENMSSIFQNLFHVHGHLWLVMKFW